MVKKKVNTKPNKKKSPKKDPNPYHKPSGVARKSQQPELIVKPNPGGHPREWTEGFIEKERLALLEWLKDPKNYFLTGFLVERGLVHEQIARFEKYSKKFCETMAIARYVQEQRLVELAVTRKGDGNFIKFILQNKAGWRERNEISGDAANPLSVIMERIALKSRNPLDDYEEFEE